MTHSTSLAMQRYSVEPRTKNMSKDMDFCHLRENTENNYWIQH